MPSEPLGGRSLRGPKMKAIDFGQQEPGDGLLGRVAAVTVMGATAIVALYFGQEVLIPAAVAVLFAFILGPVVNVLRRILPLPLAVAAWRWALWSWPAR